jgi:hypothetical protein
MNVYLSVQIWHADVSLLPRPSGFIEVRGIGFALQGSAIVMCKQPHGACRPKRGLKNIDSCASASDAASAPESGVDQRQKDGPLAWGLREGEDWLSSPKGPNTKAALKMLRRLPMRQGIHPESIIADGMVSNRAAAGKLGLSSRRQPSGMREQLHTPRPLGHPTMSA